MGNTNPTNPTNPLTTFQFNTKTVRVVTIEGNPWFVAADVCRVLKLSNTTEALRRLDAPERTTLNRTEVGMGNGAAVNFISESGLYKLVMRSDKPEAKAFQDWVTKVVLPAIRKDGAPASSQSSLPFPTTTTTAAPSNLPVPTAPVLHVKDGKVFANSRDVAETFGKRHFHVLRDIREIAPNLDASWFIETELPDAYGRMASAYDMTRDGFVLLVMGYGGPRGVPEGGS